MSKLAFSPIAMPKNNQIEFENNYAIMMVEPRNKDLETILESVEKKNGYRMGILLFWEFRERTGCKKFV